MSKKGKKFDQDVAEATEASGEATSDYTNQAAELPEEVTTLPVRKASLYLQIGEIQYRFDRRNSLPKRSEKNVDGDIRVHLDGQSIPAWITSNRAWAKDENLTLDYIWLTIPEGVDMGNGTANTEVQSGFITLDYTVDATTFEGKDVWVGTGAVERKNPARVGKVDENGNPLDAKRVASFLETVARKKAEAAMAPVPATTEENAPAAA